MKEDFSHIFPEFYVKAKHNKRKSAEQGRPIYDDVEMVKIRMAGDQKTESHFPAHSPSCVRNPHTGDRLTYAELYHEPYDAFRRNQEYVGSGTPLTELSFLTVSKRKELQDLNVYTAEALAGLEGTALQRLGIGGRELKNQAEAFLQSASGSADFTKLAAENAALSDRLAELEALLKEQKGSSEPAKEKTESEVISPFDDWEDEDIRAWIIDAGGENPHHRCKHEKLVEIADALNAELKAKEEAA